MSDSSLSSERGSWSPRSAPSPRQGQDLADRQMIRNLLCRHTMKDLERLLTEERSSLASSNDGVYQYPGTPGESLVVKSEVVDGNQISFSDIPSPRGSIASGDSLGATGRGGRKRKASLCTDATAQFLSDESSWEAEDAPVTIVSKQKGSFTCGFCLEEGIKKTCTRKNDLKRHIEDFHHTDAQWFCRHRGCNMVFDWQTAYKAHLKTCHGGCRLNLYDAKVSLCPQTVFACGFEKCTQVFEAASDADAAQVFKEYVAHVVKHFDEGVNGSQWSYSTRLRNLLRQRSVIDTFSQLMWLEEDQSRLVWETQSSSIVRKRLETRHLGDLQFLVQYTIALGSNPSGSMDSYPADLTTPIRSECVMALRNRGHGLDRAANLSPEPDHGNMRYSFPDADANTALVSYYASQRPAFVPTQQAYAFHAAQHQGMDPQYAMMVQSNKTGQAYVDMELTSNSLLGSEYAPSPMSVLGSSYPTNGLNSPAPPDEVCGIATSGPSDESRPAYGIFNAVTTFAYGTPS